MSRSPLPACLAAAGLLTAFGLATFAPARAEVVATSAAGFTVRVVTEIAAPPQKVYEALVKPEHWWRSDHTLSGKAGNLTLDATAGGCFCEALPDSGTVKHQEVVLAAPGKQLVMRGALGPFAATAVTDAFSFKLDADGDKTKVTVTFTAAGYLAEGFDDWAKKTDFVVSTQAARLKQLVETGSPEGKT
jgi:uncharacterized protein YndB with AHSA1/START domain